MLYIQTYDMFFLFSCSETNHQQVLESTEQVLEKSLYCIKHVIRNMFWMTIDANDPHR